MTNTHIVLATIGAGKLYEETIYSINGNQSSKTRFFTYALIEYLKKNDQVSEVIVLLTNGAKNGVNWVGEQVHNEPGLLRRLESMGVKVTECAIPDGNSEQQIWEIFEKIEQHVPQECKLTLDITNGFRSIPILMLLTVAYLRLIKSLDLQAVYYGAFAAQSTGITPAVSPTFDLSPFLTLLDWSNAVDAFRRSGDLRQVSNLLKERQSTLFRNNTNNRPQDLPTKFISVASQMALLTDAITVGRLRDMERPLGEIERLADEVRQSAEHWSRPFAAQIDVLLAAIKLLKKPSNDINTRLAVEFDLIKWYRRHEYLVHTGLLLREWFISWYMSQRKDNLNLAIFTNDEEREKTARELSSLTDAVVRQNSAVKITLRLAWMIKDNQSIAVDQIWQMLTNLRNDLAHFGHRSSPLDAQAIRKQIDDIIAQLQTLVEPSDSANSLSEEKS